MKYYKWNNVGKLINIEYDDIPLGYVWLGVDYNEDCDDPIFSWNMKNDNGTDWSRFGPCREEANNLILEYNGVFKIIEKRQKIIDKLL